MIQCPTCGMECVWNHTFEEWYCLRCSEVVNVECKEIFKNWKTPAYL